MGLSSCRDGGVNRGYDSVRRVQEGVTCRRQLDPSSAAEEQHLAHLRLK